jgi:hypothetical protein
MARELRIDVAYCVELNRVVDIQEACAEFFNQTKCDRFHFLCSDEECRHTRPGGVRVTAVNHYRVPAEQERSPHYRELDDHAGTCYWMELERALSEETEIEDPHDEVERNRRRAARKVKRLITKFIIPTDGSDEADGPKITSEIDIIRKEADPRVRRKALRQYARELGATATSLESLVTCFEELKDLKELGQPFTVEGRGYFTFRQAFRQIKLGSTTEFVIYYGGARLQDQRYGKGFVLRFLDPLEQMPITLYVSPEAIRRYRPSARMVRMMDQNHEAAEPKPYVRVYWIGGLERGDRGWNATFTTLAHVVLRVVQPKAKVPDGDESEVGSPNGN